MGKTIKANTETNTEQQILHAARRVFTRKGFAATRMEDIATEAGINRALLHYYFRSKQKMFDQIFEENLRTFFTSFLQAIQGNGTFEEKIRQLVDTQIEVLLHNQDLPLFIVNEIAHNPEKITERIGHLPVHAFRDQFEKMIRSEMRKGTIIKTDARQILMHVLSMCVWPFIAKPMLSAIMEWNQKEFEQMMRKRKDAIADTILLSLKK